MPQLADTRLPVSAYLETFVLPENTTDNTNATQKCNTQIIQNTQIIHNTQMIQNTEIIQNTQMIQNTQIIQNTQMIHNTQKIHITQGIYRKIKQGIGNKLGWLAKKQPNLEKLKKGKVVTH